MPMPKKALPKKAWPRDAEPPLTDIYVGRRAAVLAASRLGLNSHVPFMPKPAKKVPTEAELDAAAALIQSAAAGSADHANEAELDAAAALIQSAAASVADQT